MATESDLRDLLQGPEPEGGATIDVDAVLSRTRRRRRPKVIAAQALGSVALVGGLFTAVVVGIPQQQAAMMVAEDTAGSADEFASTPEQSDAGLERVMDACGAPLVAWPLLGWALDVSPAGSAAPDDLAVTVTLRNDSLLAESGEAALTSLTFIQDDEVVGYGILTEPAVTEAELDPGESLTWDVRVATQSCDPSTRLAPGAYDVRAVVNFNRDASEVPGEPIYGTPSTVVLQ